MIQNVPKTVNMLSDSSNGVKHYCNAIDDNDVLVPTKGWVVQFSSIIQPRI